VEEAGHPRPGTTRRRRWFLWIGIVAILIVAGYALTRLGFQLWTLAVLPDDAPRIAFSLDDTWLNTLGITDSTYQQALARAGGRLIRFEPDVAGSPVVDLDRVKLLLDEHEIDGVLLSGGGDVDPALYGGHEDSGFLVNRLRDDFEIALIHAARARGLPILGICRGCQILNVAFGGTLRNLRADAELKGAHFTFTGHPLEIREGSRLADIFGLTRFDEVHSFHGQAVDEVGSDLRATATGPEGVIEAIEGDADNHETWIIGVQWHPEMAPTDVTQNELFIAFVDQCRRRRD